MPRIKHLEEKFSIASYNLIKECSANELRFYLWLKLWAINKNSAWPSLKTICEDLGMAKWTLIRLIQEMEESGRLKIIRKHRNNNVYDITYYDNLREDKVPKLHPTGAKTAPKGGAKTAPQLPESINYKKITNGKFLNFNSFNKNKEIRGKINTLIGKIGI